MNERIQQLNEQARHCNCAHHERISIDRIVLDKGAMALVPEYLAEKGYTEVLLVADEKTYAAAGSSLHEALQQSAGLTAAQCLIPEDEQGDVVADERSIVHLMLAASATTQLLIAVGSGTIHDITRFAAYKMKLPFLSVPTAPSVDGFNSKGAPIIIKGEKITIAAIAPIAIFADLDILMKAPAPMVAAGFGDMLGKCTSLFDWRFSSAAAGEPYCELAAQVTEAALQSCMDNAELIASRNEQGIRILMTALIESGLAMLIFGQSHPASGAEHHLSHYWEMAFLREKRRQLLHGAKVGVACVQIAELYQQIAQEGMLGRLKLNAQLRDALQQALQQLPGAARITQLLQVVQAPTDTQSLDIEPELLQSSLKHAHLVRSRYTLLRAYNEQLRAN